MDDLEPLLKELRALREYLEKRDAERNKTTIFILSLIAVVGALFLLARGLHGLGWF